MLFQDFTIVSLSQGHCLGSFRQTYLMKCRSKGSFSGQIPLIDISLCNRRCTPTNVRIMINLSHLMRRFSLSFQPQTLGQIQFRNSETQFFLLKSHNLRSSCHVSTVTTVKPSTDGSSKLVV